MRNMQIVLLLGLMLTLTACGRRGPLELPEGTAAKPAAGSETTVPSIGTQKKKSTAATQVPTEPFILDPLLD